MIFGSPKFLRAPVAITKLITIVVLTLVAFIAVRSMDEQGDAVADEPLELLHVRGDIYLVGGPDSKVTVFAGEDGIVLVDSHFRENGSEILQSIRSITATPIRYVINTHGHPDHVDGNAFFRKQAKHALDEDIGVTVVAHEGAVQNMIDSGYDGDWIPTEVYSDIEPSITLGQERIRVMHVPRAHTGGDSIVFFEDSNVISIGDLYNDAMYPFVDRWKGGTTSGLVAALDKIIALADENSIAGEPPTIIVASHDGVVAKSEIVELRNMIDVVYKRVSNMVGNDLSIRQVYSREPTAGFDGKYNAGDEFWTRDAFVNGIYVEITETGNP